MSNKLNSDVQTCFKFWGVVSTILFVLSLICLICSVGFIVASTFVKQINGVSIQSYMENLFKVSYSQQIIILCSLIVIIVGFVFLTYKLKKTFKTEIKEGTPFNYKTVQDFKNLGIQFIIIPIIANLFAAVLVLYIFEVMPIIFPITILLSIFIGIKFLSYACTFRLGYSFKSQLKANN